MPAEFLSALTVSDEERAKLAKFGATSPKALLLMRKSSRAAFDDYFGHDRADAIAKELEALLTPAERESLDKPLHGAGRFGARLDPLPGRKH